LLRNPKKQRPDRQKYCKEQGRLAEASEEGLGSKRAVVPMMMMMIQLVKKFSAFYVTRRFIIVFARGHHSCLG
jgi:hypothetical protein